MENEKTSHKIVVFEKWGGLGTTKNEGVGACLAPSYFFA
jgi:hypothetical protein